MRRLGPESRDAAHSAPERRTRGSVHAKSFLRDPRYRPERFNEALVLHDPTLGSSHVRSSGRKICLPPSCSCAPGHASAPSGPRPALVRRRTERGQHAPRAGPASECPGLCGPQAVSIPASLSSQTSPDGSRAGREQASGARPTGLLSANPRPPVQLTLTPPRLCFSGRPGDSRLLQVPLNPQAGSPRPNSAPVPGGRHPSCSEGGCSWRA